MFDLITTIFQSILQYNLILDWSNVLFINQRSTKILVIDYF